MCGPGLQTAGSAEKNAAAAAAWTADGKKAELKICHKTGTDI